MKDMGKVMGELKKNHVDEIDFAIWSRTKFRLNFLPVYIFFEISPVLITNFRLGGQLDGA